MPEAAEVANTVEQCRVLVGYQHRGETLQEIAKHGKKILWVFDTFAYKQHLGMGGHWVWDPADANGGVKRQLEFVASDGTTKTLYYGQPGRGYGCIWQESEIEEGFAWMHGVQSPDLLEIAKEDVDCEAPQWWLDKINKQKRKQLYSFLYDQSNCSGIGNYLRADIMYAAEIAPTRLCGSLTSDEKRELWHAIMVIILDAYKCGGYTYRDYKRPDGKPGNYVPYIYGDKNADIVRAGSQRVYWDATVQV